MQNPTQSWIDRLIVKSARPAGTWLRDQLSDLGNQRQYNYIYIDNMAEYLIAWGVNIGSYLSELPSYHLIAVPDADIYAAIARLLRAFGDPALTEPIDVIEPDYELTLSAPATKLGTNFDLTQSGVSHTQYKADMNVPSGGSVDGEDVNIAVIDTGVESGILSTNYTSFRDLVVAGNTTHTDTYGHGSAMIKIIRDIAPGATLYAIRITDSDRFRLWDVMAGINTGVYDSGAHIINLSIGCKSLNKPCSVCGVSATNRSTVFEGFLKGLETGPDPIFACAVGNEGGTGGFHWPARYASTLAVGSINHQKDRSSFSNKGTSKGNYLLCPGGDINDLTNTITEYVGISDDNGTDVKCVGTSPSTAYSSGILALYRQKFLNDLAASNSTTTTISSGRLLDSVLTRCPRDSSEAGVARLVYDDTQPYP